MEAQSENSSTLNESFPIDDSLDGSSSIEGQDYGLRQNNPLTIKVKRLDVNDNSIQSIDLDKSLDRSSGQINNSGDFSFEDINQSSSKNESGSLFQAIESNPKTEDFSKLTQQNINSSGFQSIDETQKNIVSLQSNLNQSKSSVENTSNYAYQSYQDSVQSIEPSWSVSISKSQSSMRQDALNSSIFGLDDHLKLGNIVFDNRIVENMDQVEFMHNLKQKSLTLEEKPSKEPKNRQDQMMEEEIIQPEQQLKYLEKIQQEEKIVKTNENQTNQRKRRLFISNMLMKLGIQFTEENELHYWNIWAKTKKISQSNPLIQPDGALFTLDLQKKNKQHPIDKDFFKLIKTLPKKMINSMILGPHLTQKMIEKIFKYEWPNLKIVDFHRSVREKILAKEVLYYVTENKNNFYFLENFTQRVNLQFLVLEGNYFSDLMGQSFFSQNFPSLKKLIIDYDALLTEKMLKKIIDVRKSHLNNAEITILFNFKQYPELRRLAEALPDLPSAILFQTRRKDRENRPYVKQMQDFEFEDEMEQKLAFKVKSLEPSISLFSNKMNEQSQHQKLFENLCQAKKNQMMEDEDFVKEGQIDDLLKDINESDLMADKNPSHQLDPLFYKSEIEPIKIANHMSWLFDDDYSFQAIEDLNKMLKDWNFSNKYEKYNQAMKQTRRLQLLHSQIVEQYDGAEEQTDVFILNYAQQKHYAQPITSENIHQISKWNRFLFTAIAIDYRYHKPHIAQQLFNLEWENVTSALLQNITYRNSYQRRNSKQVVKIRNPQVNLNMLKMHNLNDKLLSLQLSGERLPTYLAKAFIEINFKKLQSLALFFRKKIKQSVIQILTCTKFKNLLNPECQIVVHSYKGKAQTYKDFFKKLLKNSLEQDRAKELAYWKEKIIFVDHFEDKADPNITDYPKDFKSSEEEMDEQEIDRLQGLIPNQMSS